MRANLLVYFLLLDGILCVVYAWQGLFTAELLALSLLLAIPFFVATAAGAFLSALLLFGWLGQSGAVRLAAGVNLAVALAVAALYGRRRPAA